MQTQAQLRAREAVEHPARGIDEEIARREVLQDARRAHIAQIQAFIDHEQLLIDNLRARNHPPPDEPRAERALSAV
jgi:hypothetical protein